VVEEAGVTVSAISWRPALVVEEAGVPEENLQLYHGDQF